MKFTVFLGLGLFLLLGCIQLNNSTHSTLVLVGDIASCTSTGDEKVAQLITQYPNATIATLGDTVYETGSAQEFKDCFDPAWKRFKDQIYPAVGNHEYKTPNAKDYFDYFGSRAGDQTKGYYSYDLNNWHIVVLNTNCDEVDCSTDSNQAKWLQNDLQHHENQTCTLAYFHESLFDVGAVHEGDVRVRPLFQLLYDYHTDVVVNGHDHVYARFAPLNPDGKTDYEQGIRVFVAGTGGREHVAFNRFVPEIQVKNNDTFGVLKFDLLSNGYNWEFVPEEGKWFSDSGTGRCR